MGKELDDTKMRMLSLGSMFGMFFGSLVTFLIPKIQILVLFIIIGCGSIFGIRYFYKLGSFDKITL